MPVRIRYRLEVGISSTSAEEKDLANAAFEVVTDDFGEGGVRKFLLPAASTDVLLQMGNIATARFIALRTNSRDPTQDPVEITVKRNVTTGEAIPVTPMDNTKEGHLLLSTSGLNALYASNAGAVAMEVTLFSCGD